MIYAIIPFNSGPNLEQKILTIDEGAYIRQAPSVYLVSYQGTTMELSHALGYMADQDENKVGTGLILSVSHYHGIASPDLWEWIESRRYGQ